MKYTLNKAAKVSGRAKSTISNAIKDGRLSANKNANGGYEIDGAELARVFPFPVGDQSSDLQPNTKNEQENRVLEIELNAERKLSERLLAEIEDLKAQRDEWMGQAKQLALPRPSNDISRKKNPIGFFGRMFGGA